MDRRIFHGNIEPNDIAQALVAEFSRGNIQAQIVGNSAKMAVQISTRMGAQSGGQTALTITVQDADDGSESEDKAADIYSLFILAMLETEIPLGHSASQAYVLVQLPNPSLSICATIFMALVFLSGAPCGNKAS